LFWTPILINTLASTKIMASDPWRVADRTPAADVVAFELARGFHGNVPIAGAGRDQRAYEFFQDNDVHDLANQ